MTKGSYVLYLTPEEYRRFNRIKKRRGMPLNSLLDYTPHRETLKRISRATGASIEAVYAKLRRERVRLLRSLI